MRRHPSGRPILPQSLRLESRRLVLRPLVPSDFPEWRSLRAANEDWLLPWEPRRPAAEYDPARSKAAFEHRCAARDREVAAGVSFGFALVHRQQLIGEVNLNSILRGASQIGTIGYWVAHAHAGNGFVAEGVVAVLAFAFDALALHRIEICIVPRNHNSLRVVEKLGIPCEGLARGLVEINGVWEDHLRFAILAEDWAERRDELEAVWLHRPLR